jgi:plasmid stability protein
MVAITIRNVPADARDRLAARAAASGRSLQEYLFAELVALATRPDPADVIERARQRIDATGRGVRTRDILQARDRDRR